MTPALTRVSARKTEISVVLGLGVLFGLAYGLIPPFRENIQEVSGLLARADIEGLRAYLLSFGVWAPVVSALLMVFQSLVAPLPAFVITLTNGFLFGAFWGTLLSWSSAMVGAMICFFVARALGRPVVERFVGKRSLEMADRFFQRYGRHSVLIARLVPIISFDVVSYAAGVTSIPFWHFILATGIGQLPATVVYSVLGQNMSATAKFGLWVFGGVAALLVLALAIKNRLEKGLVANHVDATRPVEYVKYDK